MSFAPRLPNGVRRLLRLPRSPGRMLGEMDEEVRVHLAMRSDELRALGMSEADAEIEALRRFGDSDEYRAYLQRRVVRRTRWYRAIEWLDEWTQDVRFANRQFRRNLGLTALAVLTLALGIGANTAIFTVVHRLLIAPLPYPDGNRIVKLMAGRGDDLADPTPAMVAAWRARVRSFEMIAAVSVDAFYLQDFGEPQDSVHAFVTANYLNLLGVRPAIGRDFTVRDEQPGTAVAMISYGKWQREYGGRGEALGSTIRVEDRPYTIVGVAPPEMPIPMTSATAGASSKLRQADPAIWLPTTLDSLGRADTFAKLRPGVSASTASKELQAILDSVPPTGEGQIHARAMRAQDFLDPRERQTVEVLFVAVGVLLLIACANVANLLMSRAWTRRREFAVRVALGAGRGRLARQVLTESLLLAVAGGVLGVGVAWLTLKIIIALRPPALEHLADVHVESTVLLWSAGVSVLTGILFGCAPALFAGARSVGDVLRSETRSTSGGSVARRMRSSLIVLEIAMSLVLLVGAGLVIRSFIALQRMPLAFEPRGLVSVDVMLMFRRESNLAFRAARRAEVVERLRAIPGVTEASIGIMPGQGWRAGDPLETDADASGYVRRLSSVSVTFITPDYFRVARMPLVQGRPPDSLTWAQATAAGQPTTAQEVVVNRALARRLWPNGNAIGGRLYSNRGGRGATGSYMVVGVVDDVRMPGPRRAIGPIEEVYQPLPPILGVALVLLRTRLSETEINTSIRHVVADIGRTTRGETGLPTAALVRSIVTGDTYLRESLAPTRFAMALLAAFSTIALVLSAVGLYGVIAYSVKQRTREIGVRVALGAAPGAVKRLVVGGGLKLTLVGVILGVIAAVVSTRVLAHLLYGVSPADPLTFLAITLIVVTIALVASYVPAARAIRIAPTEALRAD